MPNVNNIESPVCLVGTGRSGTTLVTNIFRRHPSFQSLGETTNLIFQTDWIAERAFPFCGPRDENMSIEEARRRAIHAILLSVYPSDKSHWFHKPIVVPANIAQWGDFNIAAERYWASHALLFPGARVFTILRHPEYLAPSMMARWSLERDEAFKRIEATYQLLLAPNSRVSMVMDFDFVTKSRDKAIRRLFGFAGCDPHPNVYRAYEKQHAENRVKPEVKRIGAPSSVLELYERLASKIEP